MISFLASPKPFIGIAKDQQYHAIRSWLASTENAEVILYGDSAGISEAGIELGVKVYKNIDCSLSGIPYFGAIVAHAAQNAQHDLQVYINSDILISGIHLALKAIDFKRYLLIGQRIDLDHNVFIDLSKENWVHELVGIVRMGKAKLHLPTGIDYFAYRKGMWENLPPIIIGRAGYDNALLAYCIMNNIPIIDGTYTVTALHQYHDYSHIEGGEKVVMQGSEAMHNLTQAGGTRSRTMVSDATYVIKKLHMISFPCRGDKLRSLELKLRYEFGYPKAALMLRMIWRIINLIGLTKLLQPSLTEVTDELVRYQIK